MQQSSVHPFRVGGLYATRDGEYEVMEITPPKMTIRYHNGRVIVADISILARIWDNMQMPAEAPEPEPRRRVPRKFPAQSRVAKAVPQFHGLTGNDFKPSVAGTNWRSLLGPLLADHLSETTGVPHRSFSVYNRPELYVAREHHFNAKQSDHQAKYLFRLTTEGAEYGFLIERDSKAMDDTWDWDRFIAALQTPGPWVEPVEAAMREHGLQAEAELTRWRTPKATQEPGPVGRWTAGAGGLEWWPPGASTATPCTWHDVADSLSRAEPRLWCDFYILGRTEKAEAIRLGERVADRATQVYAALMPLYAASAR